MEKTSSGLSQNLAGALTYLFGAVTGILFLLIEKENRFVRFHAMQSTILFGGYFVLSLIAGLASSISAFAYIWLIVSLPLAILIFVLWIYLMYQAYQGREYKLPVVGELAEKQLKNSGGSGSPPPEAETEKESEES